MYVPGPRGSMDEPNDERDTYICEACGKTFESEEALERHIHNVGLVD